MTHLGVVHILNALFSIGGYSEQLVCNVAEHLMDDIKSVKLVSRLPRVKELEEEEEFSPLLLVQLLCARKG